MCVCVCVHACVCVYVCAQAYIFLTFLLLMFYVMVFYIYIYIYIFFFNPCLLSPLYNATRAALASRRYAFNVLFREISPTIFNSDIEPSVLLYLFVRLSLCRRQLSPISCFIISVCPLVALSKATFPHFVFYYICLSACRFVEGNVSPLRVLLHLFVRLSLCRRQRMPKMCTALFCLVDIN